MKTVSSYGSFDEVIADSGAKAKEIAAKLRDLISDVLPSVVEVPWPSQRVSGYGVGPKKMTEHFCYIAAARDHVNLGFNYGAELPDPAGLLEGPGKRLRHVKIRDPKEVENPALRELLKAASKHRMPENPSQVE